MKCISKGKLEITTKECRDFFVKRAALSYDTYDSLITGINQIRCVKLNDANWKLSACNCAYFCKNYKCVHILAVAVRRDLHVFDPRASQIELEQNRKRGRPPGMAPALVAQPNLRLNANPALPQPEKRGRKAKTTPVAIGNDEAAPIVIQQAPNKRLPSRKVKK